MRKHLHWILFFLPVLAHAQNSGGRAGMPFLQLPTGPRTMALGAENITLTGEPLDALQNPSLHSDSLDHWLGMGQLFFLGGVSYTTLSYGFSEGRTGSWGVGVQYLGYGSIEAYDELGQPMGEVSVRDYAISVRKSAQQGPFSLGAALKLAGQTGLASGQTALLADVGGTFHHPARDLTFGLLVKNLGIYLSSDQLNRQPLPWDVQLGGSYKPTFMPFRFSVTAHSLGRSDLLPPEVLADGTERQASALQQTMGRLAFGVEMLFFKNLQGRIGYNYSIRRSLALQNFAGGSGFFYGLMVRVKGLQLSYTYAPYFVAGGGSFFSLGYDLQRIVPLRP